MSFVLRIEGGMDFEVGPALETLMAFGRSAALVGKDEEDRFAEFLGLADTNEEEVPAAYAEAVAGQAEELRGRTKDDGVAWFLDRLVELGVKK